MSDTYTSPSPGVSADTPASTPAEPRPGRLHRNRRSRRIRIALGTLVAVAVLVAGALVAGRWYGSTLVSPPDQLVVIAESQLADGTTIAGAVVMLRREGDGFEVLPIDITEQRSIPGTSYDTLRDALPMGGPQLLADLLVPRGADAAWLLLDERGWASVLSAAGGASVDIPAATTSFDGDRLHRFVEGPQRLNGDAAVALLLAADTLESEDDASGLRRALALALGDAVLEEPDAVRSAVDDSLAEYSGPTTQLHNFLARR